MPCPGEKKTGCAAALDTEFVWKEIKVIKKIFFSGFHGWIGGYVLVAQTQAYSLRIMFREYKYTKEQRRGGTLVLHV